MFIFIDLFCGAGGVSSGAAEAKINGKAICRLAAAVNHDPKAIASHSMNFRKTLHFTEDIRTLDLKDLKRFVKQMRVRYPGGRVVLHASLECTHFSIAKNSAKNADSRTLAEHLYRYIDELNPSYVTIENVKEFMSWGKLDKNGKPISKLNGRDYIRWKQNIEARGYRYDWRLLNAADFGAHTKRIRYFGIFAKGNLPIGWPAPTHSRTGKDDMFGKLKKWRPVKEVLDFNNEGQSIFTREKPLSEKTLARIHAGLVKYVAGGQKAFMVQRNGGKAQSKVFSIDSPARTLTTTGGNQDLVKVAFIPKYLSNSPKTGINAGASIDQPSPTITTQNRLGLAQVIIRGTKKDNTVWLDKSYSGQANHQPVTEPAGALLTKDKYSLVNVHHFLDRQFSSGGRHSSIEEPAGALLTVPKLNLVRVEHDGWLTDTQFSNVGSTLDEPAPTLVASRRHPYLVRVNGQASAGIAIFPSDSPGMVAIKEFMALYGITDIKLRMLTVPELKRIQGFRKNYYLFGNQTDQKKFIGNSVVPVVIRRWMEALGLALMESDYPVRMAA